MIIRGDALTELRKLPAESVHCCVTSPPYWGLRDYGTEGQLGLEKTPEEYVARMVEVFREVKRVLKRDVTLWLNLGDCYTSGNRPDRDPRLISETSGLTNRSSGLGRAKTPPGLKPKDLVGIPWRVAFALQSDGWYLRQDIIWAKPNPMPESVRDRCTKAHEYVFMLSKSARYRYDAEAVKEPGRAMNTHDATGPTYMAPGQTRQTGSRKTDKQRGHSRRHAGFNDRWDAMGKVGQCSMMVNLRSVWTIATRPFQEAHFATFPPELPERCIKASCPVGGVVLDPFFGAGTVGVVAKQLGRDFIGIELNHQYCEMAERRIAGVAYQMPLAKWESQKAGVVQESPSVKVSKGD